MPAYKVNLTKVKQSLPSAIELPPLLADLAGWLRKAPRGSLGSFEALTGEPLDDTYLGHTEATRAAQARLGIFLVLPDGGRLALWKHAPDAPPAVVLLGSEGEVRTVSATFEGFVHAWSRAETGVGDLDETAPGVASGRPALAARLAERGTSGPADAVRPDFAAWIQSTLAEARAKDGASTAAPPAGRSASATDTLDIPAQVLPLLGRLSTDPELIAFFASLGIDLPAITNPDVLRALVPEGRGVIFELAPPWSMPNARLAKEYPPAKRQALKRKKVTMLWGVDACAAGYRTWSNAVGDHITLAGYPGPLPRGVSFSDTREAVLEKLGPPRSDFGHKALWYDPATDQTLTVSFAESADDGVPVGAITTIGMRIRSGFEP